MSYIITLFLFHLSLLYYSCFPAPPPPSSSSCSVCCHRYRVGRWISPRISSGWSGITTRSSFSSSSTSVRTAGLVPGQISQSANPTNLPPPLLHDYIIRHHCIMYYNYNSDYIIIIYTVYIIIFNYIWCNFITDYTILLVISRWD